MGAHKYRYFMIANGLRGCYEYDHVVTVRVSTRRELKALVRQAVELQVDSGFHCHYMNETLAWAVTAAWKKSNDKKFSYPFCIPLKQERKGRSSYGVFVDTSDRATWLLENEDEVKPRDLPKPKKTGGHQYFGGLGG